MFPTGVRCAGLTLRAADQIASGAIHACQRNGFAPITATVVDPAGDVIVQKRMDGCSAAVFPEFSYAKVRPSHTAKAGYIFRTVPSCSGIERNIAAS